MRKKIAILLSMLLVTGVIYFLFSFNGSTDERQKSRKIVEDYVQMYHPEYTFKITKVSYYPWKGTYGVHVTTKDRKVEGNFDVNNGEVIHEELNLIYKE